MFYQLPPVGNPVSLIAESAEYTQEKLSSLLSSQYVTLYSSGTAALAAAITATVKAARKFKSIDQAEVILPAYACPDLISAAIFAGVKPVLVDLEAGRPWLDLSQVSTAITNNTVAIIAVNLFGISERWSLLRELAVENELFLIEDSAQYFPGLNEEHSWQGDLTVLSFGRGKPVSLLGGGVVVTNDDILSNNLPKLQLANVSKVDRLIFRLKVRLYNAMISPAIYWLPQALPFLHLGETRYHTLSDLKAIDLQRFGLLAANIRCYREDIQAYDRNSMISRMLSRYETVVDLPESCGVSMSNRLLRYPILLEVLDRNRIYLALKQAGLGASLMYPTSLPNITGVRHLLADTQRFPNAELFAQQLVTIPTHSQIDEKSVDKIGFILSQYE